MKPLAAKTPPSGLILLHKPPGITSFDALRDIKRALNTGKAGHTGTLDKFAEGLLLVLTGRALKLSKWFTHCDKQYEGTICFGAETDTLDPEGAVIATAAVPERDKVERVLSQFRGEIEQAPPAYSAIHINGERASALARRAAVQGGEAPQMQKRPVTIYRLELRSWEPPFAKVFVHCSSGTYIRSLARDLARAVDSRGYLTALVRNQVAGFTIKKEQRTESKEQGDFLSFLQPINKSVFERLAIPCIDVSLEDSKKIVQGKPLMHILKDTPSAHTAALFSGDDFIAIIEQMNGKWKYGYVYANN